jgi:hypothetical protein
MRAGLGLVLVIGFLSACTGHLLPAAPTVTLPAAETGIMGQVTIGPACPVMQVDSPCPDRPFQAVLTVTDPLGEKTIATLRTDASGYFRLALPPGDYRLVPQTPSPAAPPRAQPMPFRLKAGQWLELNVTYDSGIR